MKGPENCGSWEEAVLWLRSQPDKGDLILDGYYDDPVEAAAERYSRSEEWRAVRRIVLGCHGRSALDVGAGRGIASYALARDGFGVVALEPDPSDLVGTGAIRRLATQSGLAIEIHQRFSEQLPFGAGRFDLVFARAVLHHTQDLGAACREYFRVLKPGGLLVAIREHVISRKEDLPTFQQLHPLHTRYGGENAFLIDEYVQAIRSAGFVIRSVLTPLRSPINYAPYDRRGLCKEVGSRLSFGHAWFGWLIAALLRPALVWAAAVRVIELVDHRPGRLYSFVASRPE